MGLTIDEAIKKAREVAETNMYKAKTYDDDFLKRFHTNTDKCKQCAEEHEQLSEWLEKLKAYEQAEEDGLLIRLPCKVGDKVWLINHTICETRKTPLQCTVDEFTFDKGNRCYAVLNGDMAIYMMRRFKAVNVEQFGLTVFTSKEEAEQALAKMENS